MSNVSLSVPENVAEKVFASADRLRIEVQHYEHIHSGRVRFELFVETHCKLIEFKALLRIKEVPKEYVNSIRVSEADTMSGSE